MIGDPPPPRRSAAAAARDGLSLSLCLLFGSFMSVPAAAQDVEAAPASELVGVAPPAMITVSKAGDALGAPIELASRSAAQPSMADSATGMPSALPLASARLTSGFGMRPDPLRGGYRMHSGVDLAAAEGTPVTVPKDGVVSFSGWSGGYGMVVAVEHPGGVQTRFAHLSRILVRPGEHVKQGQLLGLVGSTGRSTGPHLHYEMRLHGMAIDPLRSR